MSEIDSPIQQWNTSPINTELASSDAAGHPLHSSQLSEFPIDKSHMQSTSDFVSHQSNSHPKFDKVEDAAYQLLSVEQVQKALNRSRASIYRYANTESGELNPPIDPARLNPEPRRHKEEPLKFALSEVERFAKHVLGIRGITIEVQESPDYASQELMKAILIELKAIRSLLESKNP
ncbi:MAG: resolvase [Cyanobacteria bacterium J06626_14]